MKLTREFFIPKNMEKVISMAGTELFMSTDTTNNNPFKAMGFSGKKAKPDFFFCFKTAERRLEFVTNWENKLRARAKLIQDRKDARKAPTTIKEGDIMYSSWGYDQTNIDWFQVTKVIGARMIELQKINGTRTYDDLQDRGTTMPVKDSFITSEKPFRKLVNNDAVTISSFARAWLWDGRSKFFSTYA